LSTRGDHPRRRPPGWQAAASTDQSTFGIGTETLTYATRQVNQLVCSDDLKAIIGRAVGDKPSRSPDASLSEALGGLEASLPVGVRSVLGEQVVFTRPLWTRRADANALVPGIGGIASQVVAANTDDLVCGVGVNHRSHHLKDLPRPLVGVSAGQRHR